MFLLIWIINFTFAKDCLEISENKIRDYGWRTFDGCQNSTKILMIKLEIKRHGLKKNRKKKLGILESYYWT